jgi:DNA-binding MarR family transcriptional regulator
VLPAGKMDELALRRNGNTWIAELSISTLGRYMVMDRTSITRALAPLERDGLIHSRSGADKRIRIVSVTNKGRKLVEDAQPKWHQAQEALIETIGVNRWRAMCTVLRDTTRMVRQRGSA